MRWALAVPILLMLAALALGGCFGGQRVKLDCYHRTIEVWDDATVRPWGVDMSALAQAMDRCDVGTRGIEQDRRK